MQDLKNLLESLDLSLIEEIAIEKEKIDPVYGKTYRYLQLVCQTVGLFDVTDKGVDIDRFYDLFNMEDSVLEYLGVSIINDNMQFAIEIASLLPQQFQKRLYDVIVRLFNFGADPNYVEVSDQDGNSRPIIFNVVDSDQPALFELFIRKGAKRSSIYKSTIIVDVGNVHNDKGSCAISVSNITKQSLFDYVVYKDNKALVDIMLYDTPENPLVFTENPLINVYKHFGLDMVKRVLQKGIDMNVSRYHGTNILVYVDNVDFCKAILDFDRTVVNMDVYGDSILYTKLLGSCYDMVLVLLEYGARFNETETFEEIKWIFDASPSNRPVEVLQALLKYQAMPKGYVYQD